MFAVVNLKKIMILTGIFYEIMTYIFWIATDKTEAIRHELSQLPAAPSFIYILIYILFSIYQLLYYTHIYYKYI